PHEPNEKLFRMFRACLDAVASAPSMTQAFVRYFEIWILRLSGFLPDLRACLSCGKQFGGTGEHAYMSFETGLRCGVCAHGSGIQLSGAVRAQMRSVLRLAPKDWSEKMSTEDWAGQQCEVSELTRSLITRALERAPRAHGSSMSGEER
ncbi:MAG: DNA repair protein RecO, partial [Pyrinomonadaceae bacterium]